MKKKLLRLGAGLFLAYVGLNLALFYRGPLHPGELRVTRRAAWVAHRFFDDRGRQPVSDSEVERLAARGLTDIFVHVGPLDAEGRIPPYRVMPWQRVARMVPGARWLAWVGGLNADFEGQAPDTVDLTRPEVRAGIVSAVQGLQRAGFAGVHYDIEPIRDGDRGFLALLDETPGFVSVATPHVRPPGMPPVMPFERMWTPDYYREVSARSEQVVYMGYDTMQPSQELYARWMRWQANQLRGLVGSELLIGLPTYDEEHSLVHDPRAETLSAALWGLSSAASVDGVALYAEWTTTEAEWETLRAWAP